MRMCAESLVDEACQLLPRLLLLKNETLTRGVHARHRWLWFALSGTEDGVLVCAEDHDRARRNPELRRRANGGEAPAIEDERRARDRRAAGGVNQREILQDRCRLDGR